jgi:3-deoxy-D-arabino-heptulosonate 7-phosphate (DAHP) synthase class II
MNEEGFSVTECLGGSMELSEEQLGLRYQVRTVVVPVGTILIPLMQR